MCTSGVLDIYKKGLINQNPKRITKVLFLYKTGLINQIPTKITKYVLCNNPLYIIFCALIMITDSCYVISPRADPKRLGDRLHTENEESCTTYNMLKVCMLSVDLC